MIRFASVLPLLALLAAAPLAAQTAPGFQLPPAPTPTADNRVQGPVDTDGPVPVRPRAIETARPTPTPTPTPAPAPTSTRAPTPAPSATAAPRSAAPSAAPASPVAARPLASPAPSPVPSLSAPSPGASAATPLPTASAVARVVLPSSSPQIAPVVIKDQQPSEPLPWLWIALGGAALAAAGAVLAWRRSGTSATPAIVTPHVPRAAPEPGEALAIAVEAVRMDRSVMNATLGYRVTIRNRSTQALSGVAVEADLVSASREVPAERQLASPGQALTPRHTADRLAPGQSLRFEGQVRLPLAEASAIWQGRAALLVPLLRVRATAAGALPVATTLVVGRSEGQASRPQPFRLDEPPRSYAPLAQRVLDAVPSGA